MSTGERLQKVGTIDPYPRQAASLGNLSAAPETVSSGLLR
jgi:hypothetical protein